MNGQVFRPDCPEALWPLLEAGARPMAGGTDLLVRLRRQPPCDVALLQGIPGLDGVGLADGQLRLGATATHARLLAHPLVRGACRRWAGLAVWLPLCHLARLAAHRHGLAGGDHCRP